MFEIDDRVRGAVLDREEFKPYEFKVRASSAGECRRLIEYHLRDGVSAPTYEQAIRMMVGTKLHEMWQEILSHALGEDFHSFEEELEVERDGIKFSGHPDGEIESLDAIYELKTVGNNTFDMVVNQDGPIQMHVEQSNVYAIAKGRSNIIIHYFNKNSGESFYCVFDSSQSLFDLTIKKFKEAFENNKASLIGPRPYSDPSNSPCWFCSKKSICYEGFEAEVKSMGDATLSVEEHSWLHDVVIACDESRDARLKCDKKEKEAKAEIGDYLSRQLKINKAKIGNYLIDIKLGSKQNLLINIKRVGE